MKYILLLGILIIKIAVFADPDRQPSIDSTKYVVIKGDTLSVYKFWKANRLNFSVLRSESKFSIKSDEWNGGEFFIELNEERNKIILQEVKNPWGPDQIILNQIETETTKFKLDHVWESYYSDNRVWFHSIIYNKELEIWSPPDLIGYFDLKSNTSKIYYLNEYYPSDLDKDRGLIWTYNYKGIMIFYMDNSNYGNPTENVRILIFDGKFKEIEIK
jgi:hypothetical protein